MHYMIGTEIVVTGKTARDVRGPQPLNVSKVQRKVRNAYFEPHVKYTLYNIRPLNDNTVDYTFQRVDGELITHKFNSIKAAEAVISSAIGENLPDYDGYHRRYS